MSSLSAIGILVLPASLGNLYYKVCQVQYCFLLHHLMILKKIDLRLLLLFQVIDKQQVTDNSSAYSAPANTTARLAQIDPWSLLIIWSLKTRETLAAEWRES